MERRAGLTLMLVALLVTGCASGSGGGSSGQASDRTGRVLRVPSQYRTIQKAVNAAGPGDLVLISPGVYPEEVRVTTSRLVIRGLDRNGVILDGHDRLVNGFEVTGDRVAVENLTVRRYAVNGVVFTSGYEGETGAGPRGWRASYVTAENNGLYGLYAFASQGGTFDHDLATGSPDSGIYVGQCHPCDAVVSSNIAEHNAIGYEATNATGVTVVGNTWTHNRIGMTTSSGKQEKLAPQSGSHIVANRVDDNADPDTPATSGGFGVGIVIGGGRNNVVETNTVSANPTAGIVVTDQDGYQPMRNRVTGNQLEGNGLDLAFGSNEAGALRVGGNCFDHNVDPAGVTSQPDDLQTSLPCGASASATTVGTVSFPVGPPGMDYRTVARSAPQPSMPEASALRWNAPPLRPPAPDLSSAAPTTGG